MLLGTLGASMLQNLLAWKEIARAGSGENIEFLVPPHPLTNFEIQK